MSVLERELTPFEEGEAAAFHNVPIRDNPYSYGSVESQDWVDGYLSLLGIDKGVN